MITFYECVKQSISNKPTSFKLTFQFYPIQKSGAKWQQGTRNEVRLSIETYSPERSQRMPCQFDENTTETCEAALQSN
jgi:hypothetical protein